MLCLKPGTKVQVRGNVQVKVQVGKTLEPSARSAFGPVSSLTAYLPIDEKVKGAVLEMLESSYRLNNKQKEKIS